MGSPTITPASAKPIIDRRPSLAKITRPVLSINRRLTILSTDDLDPAVDMFYRFPPPAYAEDEQVNYRIFSP
jgi:hypothetical protein